jgi:hypothetical protein
VELVELVELECGTQQNNNGKIYGA